MKDTALNYILQSVTVCQRDSVYWETSVLKRCLRALINRETVQCAILDRKYHLGTESQG